MKLAKRLGAITLASTMVLTSVPVVTMASETTTNIEMIEEVIEEAVIEEVASTEEIITEDRAATVEITGTSEDSTAVKIAKAALALTIEAAKEYESSNYTDSVIAALETAIAAAEAEVIKTKVLVNNEYKYIHSVDENGTKYYELEEAFEGALNDLKDKIDAAVSGLAAGDLTSLVKAIEAAKALDKNDYDMKAVQEAIKEAESKLLELKVAGTSELETTVQALNDAIAAAKNQDTELKDTIKDAEAVVAEEYTAYSFAALQKAIEAAKEVLNAEKFNKGNADKQVVALNAAKNALVSVKDLSAEITKAQEFVMSDYTRYSWESFEVALDKAVKAFENTQDVAQNLGKTYVDSAKNSLGKAVKALVSVKELNTTYNEIMALNIVNPGAEAGAADTLKTYTDSTWSEYTKKVEAAKKVLADAKNPSPATGAAPHLPDRT